MPETVLIVDDDPAQRCALEALVRRFGYEAVTAEGGDAALKFLIGAESRRIDCVVLDLIMPDLDGLGVLARMRKMDCDIPVIVQTAPGGIDNVASAMRTGAMDFLVKPVEAERLQVSLRKALSAREMPRANIVDTDPNQIFIEPSPTIIASWPEDHALSDAAPKLHLTDSRGDIRPLHDIEQEIIRIAIAHYGGQMSEAARRLKIGRSTLYRKLESIEADNEQTIDVREHAPTY